MLYCCSNHFSREHEVFVGFQRKLYESFPSIGKHKEMCRIQTMTLKKLPRRFRTSIARSWMQPITISSQKTSSSRSPGQVLPGFKTAYSSISYTSPKGCSMDPCPKSKSFSFLQNLLLLSCQLHSPLIRNVEVILEFFLPILLHLVLSVPFCNGSLALLLLQHRASLVTLQRSTT